MTQGKEPTIRSEFLKVPILFGFSRVEVANTLAYYDTATITAV